MKSITLTALLCLCYSLCNSQKSPLKFGDIKMEDMQMTIYDKDSSAVAVILLDYGKAYIGINAVSASLNFERHIRVKILKNDGLKWADASIPLYSSTSEERVTNLKASTYNIVNDKIVETKMSKDGIFKEKFNSNINYQKFTLPDVKVGSIIEYSYTILSDFVTAFPNWQFQYEIPVRLSEYWAIIPEFFIMEKYLQGYIPVTTYETSQKQQSGYSENAFHWAIKEVPAFKAEPFMTTEKDYISKINFALSYINYPGQIPQEIMGSWSKLNTVLLEDENFGKVIYGSVFLKKQVEELLLGITDEKQKLEVIHNYVKKNIEWDGTRDFLAGNLKKVFETKKGSSGDINLTLAAMLNRAGIPVDMVLLSTRDHGFIRKEYPMTKQFNYAVCAARVNNEVIFLDATEKFLPINVLPERCLNGEGLIISKNNFGWIDLKSKAKNKATVNAELELASSGDLHGKVTFTREGYNAINTRKSLSKDGEGEYIKSTYSNNWSFNKSVVENISEPDKPLTEIHDVTIPEAVSKTGDVIYINPFIAEQIIETPFRLKDRLYPVDFGSAQETTYMCKIKLPEGYSVDELPTAKAMQMPGNAGRYLYSITQLGDNINITSVFQINKNIFLQAEYSTLREFYDQVIAKQGEQIVLRKTK